MPFVAVKKPEGYEDNTWWHGKSVSYAFGHPKVRMRLERLMGTNMVLLTDRRYMRALKESIFYDLLNEENERIHGRIEREDDRVMDLIMNGVIDMADAPQEYHNHPVYLLVMDTRKLIKKRHKRIMIGRYHSIRKYSYSCPTTDMKALAEPRAIEPFAEMVERGIWTEYGEPPRPEFPPGFIDPMKILLPEDVTDDNYIFAKDSQYHPYENPGVKEVQKAQTVNELYNISDHVIGSLHTVKKNPLINVKYHI